MCILDFWIRVTINPVSWGTSVVPKPSHRLDWDVRIYLISALNLRCALYDGTMSFVPLNITAYLILTFTDALKHAIDALQHKCEHFTTNSAGVYPVRIVITIFSLCLTFCWSSPLLIITLHLPYILIFSHIRLVSKEMSSDMYWLSGSPVSLAASPSFLAWKITCFVLCEEVSTTSLWRSFETEQISLTDYWTYSCDASNSEMLAELLFPFWLFGWGVFVSLPQAGIIHDWPLSFV
jgi:hypothetical protein